jgi:hypothetical protein
MTDADRAIEAAKKALAAGLPVKVVEFGKFRLVLANEDREPEIDWRKK